MKPTLIPCTLSEDRTKLLWLPPDMNVVVRPERAGNGYYRKYGPDWSLVDFNHEGLAKLNERGYDIRPLPLRRVAPGQSFFAPIGQTGTLHAIRHGEQTHTGSRDYHRSTYETDCGLVVKDFTEAERKEAPITCPACRAQMDEWVVAIVVGPPYAPVKAPKARKPTPTAYEHLAGEVDYGSKTVRHPVHEPILEDLVRDERDRKMDRFSARGA